MILEFLRNCVGKGSRTLFLAATIQGFCLAPTVAIAQESPRQSVVRIECDLHTNKGLKRLTSTGFVAKDENHVVTALHGVVGCDNLNVLSGEDDNTSLAIVVRASIEGDLALLRLETPWGVPPLGASSDPPKPKLTDMFAIWGYPGRVTEILGAPLALDLNSKELTLENAFEGTSALDGFFVNRTYPTKSTLVIRVPDTSFYPAQSGSPVLNAQGLVVAIADGVLAKEILPVSWTVPAYKYLVPLLHDQEKPPPGVVEGPDIPTRPERLDQLVAASTPLKEKTVAVPSDAVTSGATAIAELRAFRTLSLAELEKKMLAEDKKTPNIKFIRGRVSPEQFDRLSFDIYLDPKTGATLGVPSSVALIWNGDIRAIKGETESGSAFMMVGVTESQSYTEAKTAAKNAFVGEIAKLAKWEESLAEYPYSYLDDSFEYANFAKFFDGTDSAGNPVNVNLSITVKGKQLMGYAVYGPNTNKVPVSEIPKEDLNTYLMMQFAVQELSDFAVR